MQAREQGWECPKCQRIWAPKINACGHCNIGAKTAPETYRPLPPYGTLWDLQDPGSW